MLGILLFSELKNHPYFHGIDWEQVADRKCDAPFEPIEILLDQNDHLDLFELMEIDVNYKLDAITAKRIHSELKEEYCIGIIAWYLMLSWFFVVFFTKFFCLLFF